MASAFPRRGLFWGTARRESAGLCREQLSGARLGAAMSRRRKSSYQRTSQYNAYLAGWAFAFLVVLVTYMLIAHGVHF
jgi:hypothetical protein